MPPGSEDDSQSATRSHIRLANVEHSFFKSQRLTAAEIDQIPAWPLKVGAYVFAGPLAALMNMSLNSSVVPKQWSNASILPVAKVSAEDTERLLTNFYHISVIQDT